MKRIRLDKFKCYEPINYWSVDFRDKRKISIKCHCTCKSIIIVKIINK